MPLITVTNRQLLDLRRALGSLDGVKTGTNGEISPFEFDAATRTKLMRNAAMVERESFVFEAIEQKFRAETGVYDGMDRNDANAVRLAAFTTKLNDALAVTLDIDLHFLKMNDLLVPKTPRLMSEKPAVNLIPQSVLNKLALIIQEEAGS